MIMPCVVASSVSQDVLAAAFNRVVDMHHTQHGIRRTWHLLAVLLFVSHICAYTTSTNCVHVTTWVYGFDMRQGFCARPWASLIVSAHAVGVNE